MCPPESCCCCKLPLGVKIGAGLLLAYVLLAMILVLVFADQDTDAFCSFEHLEESTECGESCAVHESGAWFTSSPDFDEFSPETYAGYSGPLIPVVPLCSSGQGAHKVYVAPTEGSGVTGEHAEEVCTSYGDGSFRLASIASAEENERARKTCGDNSCWLGLQSANQLHWTPPSAWTDGTSFTYANWWPVNQPPAVEDSPQVFVFMNIPGVEPGEHCTSVTIHMYLEVLGLLCVGVLAALALTGANSLDRQRLNIAWQAWIGVWLVTLVQSAVETAQYTGRNVFAPAAWTWGFWAFGELLVAAPLNVWWVISVRSLAGQCQAIDDEDAAQNAPQPAVKTQAALMTFNPLRALDEDDIDDTGVSASNVANPARKERVEEANMDDE